MALELVARFDEGEPGAVHLKGRLLEDGLEGKDKSSCVSDKTQLADVRGGLIPSN